MTYQNNRGRKTKDKKIACILIDPLFFNIIFPIIIRFGALFAPSLFSRKTFYLKSNSDAVYTTAIPVRWSCNGTLLEPFPISFRLPHKRKEKVKYFNVGSFTVKLLTYLELILQK